MTNDLMQSSLPPLSLYIHIPFCTHRCAYCDFNTYAGQEAMIPAYVTALCREIQFVGRRLPAPLSGAGREAEYDRASGEVHTVFLGGGTPSLLAARHLASILKAIRDNFALTGDAEITIEANPGTISPGALQELHALGINRISYGVQSANALELRMLERAHNFLDVIEAVTSARRAGFENLNLDLIYGLPEQSLQSWQTTVRRILDLHPEHISAYALTLEHGTPFGRWASRGLLPLPDPDLAADMYEWAGEMLEANGYFHYEISNWARDLIPGGGQHRADPDRHPAFACRHNLQYWHSLPYLGLGAGAHGYVGGYRYSNVLRIKTYIDRLINDPVTHDSFSDLHLPLSPATVNRHTQSRDDDLSDYMLNNLRLVKAGISKSDFRLRFGEELTDVYTAELRDLVGMGLLEWMGDRIRLTPRGRLLGNQVFLRFVE